MEGEPKAEGQDVERINYFERLANQLEKQFLDLRENNPFVKLALEIEWEEEIGQQEGIQNHPDVLFAKGIEKSRKEVRAKIEDLKGK